MLQFARLLIALFCTSLLSPDLWAQRLRAGKGPSDYQQYQPDLSKLAADKEMYQEYQKLGEKARKEGFRRDLFERRIALLEDYLKRNPEDVDAHWLIANDIMRVGESYDSSKPEKLTKIRESLVQAEAYAERCLELRPKFPLCQFFLGAAIGKTATIDGIFSSLNRARKIHGLWAEVYRSQMDYQFEDGYSLQGIVRYTLGIYYRVVPNFFLLRWIFGISGDIDKSIALHQESVGFPGGDSACTYMELSVSLLCKSRGNPDDKLTKKAWTHLDRISKKTTTSEDVMICIQDASRVRQDPSQACGYTKARQQETDEDAIKKQLEKERS